MTKISIMATVADVRCTPELISSLREAGMDSVRINSAHVNPESIKRMVSIIRGVDPDIRILMDTKGPEIRTTAPLESLDITCGSRWIITSGTEPSSEGRIVVAVADIHKYLHQGLIVLVDDGALSFRINSVTDDGAEATALLNGTLNARKTVAIPGIDLPPLPAVSERDHINIIAAREAGIDMIAHSFVRDKADVEALRAEIEGTDIELYSKIECRQAMNNLDEIVEASDGLLVARGDLGTQMPITEIPTLQFQILKACHKADKPAIVATQMLNSMMSAPTPTRAEVSDIALAVMEGASALLLCGETAQGSYPSECVATMRATIDATQQAGLCNIL